jgi:hypothetical protein
MAGGHPINRTPLDERELASQSFRKYLKWTAGEVVQAECAQLNAQFSGPPDAAHNISG